MVSWRHSESEAATWSRNHAQQTRALDQLEDVVHERALVVSAGAGVAVRVVAGGVGGAAAGASAVCVGQKLARSVSCAATTRPHVSGLPSPSPKYSALDGPAWPNPGFGG